MQVRDMGRLLFFLAIIVHCQNGNFGKPVYNDKFVSPDFMYPAGQSEYPRHSQILTRNIDGQKAPEQSSMCYFLQESDVESQISCKLRFTRSKFNFNPFGLRFGKRGDGGSVNWKTLVVNGNRLRYLWKHKIPACKDSQSEC
ncbi:kisspeptin 2 isoform X1 [Leucoraja erinacea]|uniref:kisspeptin 2 isoform X1 n=2 Tax=Leucoraja erinaceus TaxID=7782 RepID=UPI0024544D8B|nr:kisspeptin 2 isoform X1 [Leucoraja erinacea]